MQSMFDVCVTLFSVWAALSVPYLPWIKISFGVLIFCGLQFLISLLANSVHGEWNLRQLLAAISGAVFGLLLANMIIVPSSIYLTNFSELHHAVAAIFSFTMMILFSKIFIKYEPKILHASVVKTAASNTHMIKILDTNAIIDGRIGKLVKVQFVEGLIVIPEFVLDELKKIADEGDELKRPRGKLALKTVNQMLDEYDYVVRYETEPVKDVDQSLIALAKNLNAKIITCDANLIELAKSKNIHVININELSVAFQLVHLRGQEMTVKIVEAGSGQGQGLAYTEDGTMIVIENGEQHIKETVDIVISRHLQSKYGVMLFAEIA